MMNAQQALALARGMLPTWKEQADHVNILDKWVRGENDKPKIPPKASDEYKAIAELARTPWLALVVSTLAQLLYVDGFRPSEKLEVGETSPVWRAWQANRLDAQQIALHRAALAHGVAFQTTLPGSMFGEDMALIRASSARRLYAEYADPVSDEWPMQALMVDVSSDGKRLLMRLLTEQQQFVLTSDSDFDNMEYLTDDVHDLGFCPVIRFTNTPDLDGRVQSEIEKFLPLARRIDQTDFDRLVTQRFSAWKVRTIAGMIKPETDAEERAKKIELRQEDLLISESVDTKFGTLEETSVEGFISARNADVGALAATSQTSPTAFGPSQVSNISAEALASLEVQTTRHATEIKTGFGESHEQQLRGTAFVIGDDTAARDVSAEVIWRDMESKSLAAAADALGKLAGQLGIPPQVLWSKIPGWTQQDVEMAEKAKREDDELGKMLAEFVAQGASFSDGVDV